MAEIGGYNTKHNKTPKKDIVAKRVILIILFIMLVFALYPFYGKPSLMYEEIEIKKGINQLIQTAVTGEIDNKKCEFSSEGLAKYFHSDHPGTVLINNVVTDNNQSLTYLFIGDGSCLTKLACYVVLTTEKGTTAAINLYSNNGYLFIKEEDLAKYRNNK